MCRFSIVFGLISKDHVHLKCHYPHLTKKKKKKSVKRKNTRQPFDQIFKLTEEYHSFYLKILVNSTKKTNRLKKELNLNLELLEDDNKILIC